MRPFANNVLRSELWRFTRRSVPRGAALGMIVGIFVMIPGLQMIVSTLLALPFRANIPVAAAVTWSSNPVTTPFILIGALFVGNDVFQLDADLSRLNEMLEQGASFSEWAGWLASDAAPAIVGGLLIIALIAGAITYFVAKWFWHYRTARKWRKRQPSAQSEAS